MPRILSLIVGVERISNGHVTTYLERLACGHTGQSRRTEQTVRAAIAAHQRRLCKRCTHNR